MGEESGWPTDEDFEASITTGACSKQLWVSSLISPMVIFSTSSWVYIWILDTTLQNSLPPENKNQPQKSWMSRNLYLRFSKRTTINKVHSAISLCCKVCYLQFPSTASFVFIFTCFNHIILLLYESTEKQNSFTRCHLSCI